MDEVRERRQVIASPDPARAVAATITVTERMGVRVAAVAEVFRAVVDEAVEVRAGEVRNALNVRARTTPLTTRAGIP